MTTPHLCLLLFFIHSDYRIDVICVIQLAKFGPSFCVQNPELYSEYSRGLKALNHAYPRYCEFIYKIMRLVMVVFGASFRIAPAAGLFHDGAFFTPYVQKNNNKSKGRGDMFENFVDTHTAAKRGSFFANPTIFPQLWCFSIAVRLLNQHYVCLWGFS